SRYYHSQIDMELLLTGMEYGSLPDAYVIFICDFDPFYKKKYKYTFETVCKEVGMVSLEDGNHTLFLSTHGENEEEVPEGLVKFLKYVSAGLDESTEDFQDNFVQKLQEAVKNVKASREMEERYMLLEELLKEERESGKAEGKAETILVFLSRLGEVPIELREKILHEKNLDILNSYSEKAAMSNTMEEFRKLIEQP
ncbi:MAG: hypothetical protein PUK34_11135, partial [Clostridia bacterium]|nr:hypothetical protein [Clostridia bacterium]